MVWGQQNLNSIIANTMILASDKVSGEKPIKQEFGENRDESRILGHHNLNKI